MATPDVTSPTSLAPTTPGWTWVRGYMLFMLVTATAFNTLDRQLVSMLLEPIKAELRVSDTQMGLLTGLYFSLLYAMTSIPLARLADHSNRRTLIAACVGFWSLATMACGMAQSYLQLAIARMGVAIGEGGSSPAIQSLVSDAFPVKVRTFVLGLISGGSAIGLALGIFLGGTLNEHIGWRNVFLVIGAPGVLFALLLLLTVKEPARPILADKEPRRSILHALRAFWRMPTLRLIGFIAMGGASTGFAMLAWTPAFFMRVHGFDTAEVGLKMGLAVAIGLFAGNISAGLIADRMAQRDPKWLILVGGLGLLMCPPLALLMAFVPSSTIALITFGFFMFFNAFMPPCMQASAISIVSPRSRALVAAVVGLCIVAGGAIGPFIVGALNDLLHAGQGVEAIRTSIACAAITAGLAGVAGLFGARLMAKDYKGEPAAL